jgi:hypothetical protein
LTAYKKYAIIKIQKEKEITKMSSQEMNFYDYLVETGIATVNELNLCMSISDWRDWMECLEAVLYARTGYRTLEQLMEEEDL